MGKTYNAYAHLRRHRHPLRRASGSQAPTVYVRGLSLVASRQGSVTRYYHYNVHGDATQLTDASGAVVQSYSYDAFGVESTPSADPNPFRYCGEQRDPETGNYYLRARYYSPATGRFTQADTVPYVANDYPNGQTLIDPLSLNLYTYCANDPVQNHDPSGHTELALNWSSDAQVFMTADGPFPFGDMVYVAGLGVMMVLDAILLLGADETARLVEEQHATGLGGGKAAAGSGVGRFTGASETAGGGPNRDDDNDDHMIGANGTQVTSQRVGKSGSSRVDVENPNPGKRPGDLHYHDARGMKWRYNIKTGQLVNPKTGALAPSSVQVIKNAPWFISAIEKGLKILGEIK